MGRVKVHKLEITAYPAPGEKTLGRIEVVSNYGQVIAAKQNFEGGRLAYKHAGRAQAAYVLVRIFGAEEAPGKPGRYHAVTNPVYLHPAGFRVPRRPTSCRI